MSRWTPPPRLDVAIAVMFVDWYDSALGKLHGVDAVQASNDLTGTFWGSRSSPCPALSA